MLTLEALKEILEFHKKFTDYTDKLADLGIELIDTPVWNNFYEMFDKIIIISFNEVQADYIFWWLYEDVEKIIYHSDGSKTDVTELEDLYKYLETLNK